MKVSQERQMTAAKRKVIVVVMYGAFAAAAGLWAAAGGLKPLPVAALVTAGILVSLAALVMLLQGTHFWRWGNAPDQDLDEFERASRNEAYRTSYVTVATLSLLALISIRIGSDLTTFRIADSAMDILFWGWFLLVVTLPTAVLAWKAKTFEDDDAAPASALSSGWR